MKNEHYIQGGDIYDWLQIDERVIIECVFCWTSAQQELTNIGKKK